MLSQIYEISFLSTLSIMHMLEPGPLQHNLINVSRRRSPLPAHNSAPQSARPWPSPHRWWTPRWRGWQGGRHGGMGGGGECNDGEGGTGEGGAGVDGGGVDAAMATAATATAPLLLPLPLAPLLLPLLLLQLRMLSAQASKVRGGQNHHTAAINARCRRVPPALGPATIRRVRSTRWSRLGVRSMRWSRPCKALLAKSPPTSLPPMPSQPVSTTPPSPTPPAAAAPPK